MKKKAYYADYIWFDSKPVRNSWLIVDNGVINGCQAEVTECCEKVIFKNSSIFPSFVNTHAHSAMVYFRGLADDLPLMEWLNKHIWPLENSLVTEEFVRDATELAVAELVKSGVSCVNDMYFYASVSGEVYEKYGMRAVVGRGMMNEPGNINKSYLNEVLKMVEIYKDSELIKISLCPHALYTVSVKDFKEMVDFSIKHDVLVHTHLSESMWEYNEILNKHGKTPVEVMNETGAFDCSSVFAHCVHLSDNDIKLLGDKKVNVSHCLKSNLKLASGFAPVNKMIEAGANVCIGTDGAASNNSLSMLSELQTAALFHKGLSNDPTALNAETALTVASANGASALGFKKTGILKEENYADFMVVSNEAPHMQPDFNPLSQLIYSAEKNDITDLFVAGVPLMRNRKLMMIDEEKVALNSAKWRKIIMGRN